MSGADETRRSGDAEPAAGAPDDEEQLVAYVEAALAALDAGTEPDLDAICARHPHLRKAVAQAVGLDGAVPDATPTETVTGARVEAADPRLGRMLGDRYELLECIGLGAMGAVYRSHDRRLHRDVAVKVMHNGLFPDAGRRARFAREARVLAALQTPFVVPVHDHGETEDGTMYLVMDRLQGVSLASVLATAGEGGIDLLSRDWAGDLPVEVSERDYLRQVVAWVEELARGLAAAHAQGITHRDVKPSNGFITTAGRAVLLDFGIAARAGDSGLTVTDSALGTPWYMAPEQAGGGDTAQPAVDVYGLGATLYHLLTFRSPYQGTPAEVIFQLRTADPVPPRVLQPTIPADLAAILERALERDAAQRYPTVAQFADDLAAFRAGRPVAARPLSRWGRLWRKARRRPAATAAGVAVAVLVPVTGWALWLSSQREAARGEARFADLAATVPALVCLEGYPDKRVAQDLAESGIALELFSEMLALRPADPATRMMRAALRLDRGERAAAVEDLEQLCHHHDTPYTAALLRAYRDAEDSVAGAQAVRIADLPPPQTAADRFLAGFHLLRLRTDYQAAATYLDQAADELLPARELRLLSWLMLASLETRAGPRRDAFGRVYAEALKLEGIYGRSTARTAHVIGAALVGMKRYADAIPRLRASLELRPQRHGPLHNLGIAYRRLGDQENAEACLQQAHRLRPWMWNTIQTLAQLRCDLGQYDVALELAGKIPDTGTMGEEWQKPLLQGQVHLRQAAAAARGGDLVAAAAAARRALPYLDRCATAGGKARAARARLLADALGAGKIDPVALLIGWRQDFTNPAMILNLEAFLGARSTVDADTTFALRVYLLRLAAELAPDDPAPAARLRTLFGKEK